MPAMIQSYTDAVRLFQTARDKERGKPLRSFANMTLEGGVYVISIHGHNLAKVHPDNTLEYVASPELYRDRHNTISMSFHHIVPVQSIRVSTNKYRIGHVKWMGSREVTFQQYGSGGTATYVRKDWEKLRAEGQEYFQGVKIDLHSGEVVNPREDMTVNIISENRKTWLRSLRNFKNGIRVRGKLGVFDAMINEMNVANTNRWDHHVRWVNEAFSLLSMNMKEGTFNDDLMQLLVKHTRYQSYGTITGQHVVNATMNLLKDQSVSLRREFEVFGNAE